MAFEAGAWEKSLGSSCELVLPFSITTRRSGWGQCRTTLGGTEAANLGSNPGSNLTSLKRGNNGSKKFTTTWPNRSLLAELSCFAVRPPHRGRRALIDCLQLG